jgi:hypothetical protein
MSVSAHITARQSSRNVPRAVRTKAGVAVPAIRKKIIAWSRRCRRFLQTALQVPRWYSALNPNSALTLSEYTPIAMMCVAPWARASMSGPSTSDTANQNKCSQPRRTGLA